MEYSYIANSGIQLITFPVEIDTQDIFKKWFREWYDKELGLYHLDVLECIDDEGRSLFFNQKDLFDNGYLAKGIKKLTANGTKPGRAAILSSANSAANSQSIIKTFASEKEELKTVLGANSYPTSTSGCRCLTSSCAHPMCLRRGLSTGCDASSSLMVKLTVRPSSM